MANRRFPKCEDMVKIIKGNKAKTYENWELKVKRAPFVFDRDIVAQLEGVRGYVSIKNLEIVKYCD